MKEKNISRTKNLILCALFAAFIAVGAFIKIPIPVCPFTLQLLFTTMAGMILGPKWGSLSVIIYVILGLMGVPVFVEGGGIGYVLKPTFGYLIGFVIGTYLTGSIIYKSKKITLQKILLGGFVGLIAVYICGTIYYYILCNFVISMPISAWTVFLYCFLMVVPGDIVLTIVSAFLAKKLISILRRSRYNA